MTPGFGPVDEACKHVPDFKAVIVMPADSHVFLLSSILEGGEEVNPLAERQETKKFINVAKPSLGSQGNMPCTNRAEF